jgi:Centrosome microtubule-binding domain of Cep57
MDFKAWHLSDSGPGRRIYTELADQYKMMDAASNVVKRNVLAQHLRDVIDVLEQRVRDSALYNLKLRLITFTVKFRVIRSPHSTIS